MNFPPDTRRFGNPKGKPGIRAAEGILLFVGLLLTFAYLGVRLDSFVGDRIALAHFAAEKESIGRIASARHAGNQAEPDVDFSQWSDKRINAYQQSLATYSNLPTAVLDIPKLRLRVPVFDGTDDLTLNRGVGRIIGTAEPDQIGNIGVAGHRDGFFRGLKDVAVGDTIDLETPNANRTYVVNQVRVVSPDDVSVLKSTPTPSLTLVTCYPFYFVGDAPMRYIVSASLRKEEVREKNNVGLARLQKPRKEEPRHE
jgi:sortase A